MGVHLIDSSDTSLVPGEYDFNQIIINGVWDGRYTFIEPMITRDWLLTGPSLEQPLKQPERISGERLLPDLVRRPRRPADEGVRRLTHRSDDAHGFVGTAGRTELRTSPAAPCRDDDEGPAFEIAGPSSTFSARAGTWTAT